MEEHHQHVGPAVNVIKGKRTKRQRPQSPIPFEVADPPSDPETATTTTTSTEEEEDMANCLILLAQGQSRISSPDDVDHPNNVIYRTTTNVVINNNNNNKEEENYHPDPVKFSSRRYLEASGAAGTGNKAGYYVYQCKTCDRTFPSFQALGGHRASHKKPKQGNSNSPGESHFPVPERRQLFSLLPSPSSDEERQFRKLSSLSLQLSSNNNNNKVHECSICGAEFTSGQALGGHMRRHRSTPIGSNSTANNTIQHHVPRSGAITTLSLTPLINKLDEAPTERRQQQQQPDTRPRTSMKVLSLDLDLNLPASGQDQDQIPQHGQNSSDANKLQIDNSQQKKSNNNNQSSSSSINVFSAAPALVDCHY